MERYTSRKGFPAWFTPPVGTFRLDYSKRALEVAKALDLDTSYLPIQLVTSRAELVEVIRDGATTEHLHYRARIGERDIVLVIDPSAHWCVVNFLEVDG
jgi:hypothetical protein